MNGLTRIGDDNLRRLRFGLLPGVGPFVVLTLIPDSGNDAVVAISGTIVVEPPPYPVPSDAKIFLFDEQQDVAFVDSQPLHFGNTTAGTRVSNYYLRHIPVATTGFEGTGAARFDGHFRLQYSLGTHPTGAGPGSRGPEPSSLPNARDGCRPSEGGFQQ